ncbi:MAG: alpha/beta fold hydrolase [Polyangiaceae bacterium]
MIRQGEGSPLVLFHGILGSERMWGRVVPLLAAKHDTIAPTALGHRGGPRASMWPARIEHVVDDAERLLDELGLATAHLAGNSLGGWVALELARRGRARSVCAFSPAGCWPRTRDPNRTSALRGTIRVTRRGRRLLPLLARSARFRRWAMRLNAVRGDRVTASELVELGRDVLGCTIANDLLERQEGLDPLESTPCPITLAWSEKDRIFPVAEYGARARALVPGARFLVLEDVGHVPMFDSPELVATTVLETTGAVARLPRDIL